MSEELKPVAWMWQHNETGMTGFVQDAPADELRQWERMNKPRRIVAPLYASPLPQTQGEDAATELLRQLAENVDRLGHGSYSLESREGFDAQLFIDQVRGVLSRAEKENQ